MRLKYRRHPITSKWSSTQPEGLGDGINLGLSGGAATQLMDGAWWGPTSMLTPDGPAIFHVSERSKPGSLIVDQSGVRYFSESTDYVLAGQTMYKRNAEVPARGRRRTPLRPPALRPSDFHIECIAWIRSRSPPGEEAIAAGESVHDLRALGRCVLHRHVAGRGPCHTGDAIVIDGGSSHRSELCCYNTVHAVDERGKTCRRTSNRRRCPLKCRTCSSAASASGAAVSA